MTDSLAPYPERLAAIVAATGPVLAVSTCQVCGARMEDRANEALTDHGWHTVDAAPFPDPWAVLDAYLEAGDVAAYSRAKAHRGLAGRWPWEHNHRPVPLNS